MENEIENLLSSLTISVMCPLVFCFTLLQAAALSISTPDHIIHP